MKKIKAILIMILMLVGIKSEAVTFDAYYPTDERPSSSIILRAGTIIKAVNLRNINTFTNDIGDECEFINVIDMFVGDYMVLAKNSHIYGVVEDIREPVQGNNAAIKIKINKIITADGETTYFVEGHLGGGSDFYIGGGQTAPAYYKKTPHYSKGWGHGILQLTPLNIYGYGKHTQIKAGEEVFVILEKDLKIY